MYTNNKCPNSFIWNINGDTICKKFIESFTNNLFNKNFFVISMNTKEGKRRMRTIKNSIIGDKIEKVDAVNGNETDIENLINNNDVKREWNSKIWGGPNKILKMTDNEIGCSLSHKKVWKKIVDNNLDLAIVLEDDASNIDDEFYDKIYKIFNKVPKDWDIILLGFWIQPQLKQSIKINDNIYKVKQFSLTHSYIINNKTAKFLLEQKPLDCPLDTWMSKFSDQINIYRHNYLLDYLKNASSLIVQDFEYSEIEHSN